MNASSLTFTLISLDSLTSANVDKMKPNSMKNACLYVKRKPECVFPCPPLPSAITLENTLVILSTVAPDAGRYYVQAVNDKNGENKTSQPITLSVESE